MPSHWYGICGNLPWHDDVLRFEDTVSQTSNRRTDAMPDMSSQQMDPTTAYEVHKHLEEKRS